MLGFLRCGIYPGGSAYGLLRCTSSRCVWLRQTVAALPPPDQSLRSACRRAGESRSRAGELALGLLSGEGRACLALVFVVFSPLTPALSRGRGGRLVGFSKFGFDSVFHVGVPLPIHAISPLSLREGEGADWWDFQDMRSTRSFTSAYLSQSMRSVPSPSGRGLG